MATIPLMFQPTQPLLTGEQKANALATLAGQNLMNQQRQQAVSEGDIKLQQERQMLDDQNTFRNSLAANGGDWEKALSDVSGKIGLPAYQTFYTQHLNNLKEVAEIGDKALPTVKDALDRATKLHGDTKDLTNEQFVENWPDIARKGNDIFNSVPVIPGRPRQQLLDPNTPMDRQQWNNLELGLQTQSAYTENKLKEQQEKTAAATETKTQLENTKALNEQSNERRTTAANWLSATTDQASRDRVFKALEENGTPPEILAQFDRQYSPEAVQRDRAAAIGPVEQARIAAQTPPVKLEMNDWLAKHPGKGPADFMAYEKTLIPQFNINMGGLGPTNAAAIPQAPPPGAAPGTLPTIPALPQGPGGPIDYSKLPPQLANGVKAIIERREPMPPQSRNNPTNQATRYWVNALDPTYQETDYPAKNKAAIAFSTGKEGQQIQAINTALGHIGTLDAAIDGLNNGDVRILNGIANRLGLEVGQTPMATFKTIVHRVGPEISTAYVAGGGGEKERGTTEADFDSSLAPQILHNNTAITAQLLRSKIGSLEQTWKNTYLPTTPRDEFNTRFMTPAAQATLNKLSANSPVKDNTMRANPQSLTAADVTAYAKAHNVSEDEVKKQARAKGIQVP